MRPLLRLQCPAHAESGAGQPIPLPNVSALSLERVLRYYEQRVAEAAAATERKPVDLRRLTAVAESARRLAAEAEAKRAVAAGREQRLAAEAAEAQRLAAEAQRLAAETVALHQAGAQEAEHLAAKAAEAERLAAEAEAAVQQLSSRAVAEPGTPAALGGTGEDFAGWEETFIAQTGAGSLLLIISVRLGVCLPPCRRSFQATMWSSSLAQSGEG